MSFNIQEQVERALEEKELPRLKSVPLDDRLAFFTLIGDNLRVSRFKTDHVFPDTEIRVYKNIKFPNKNFSVDGVGPFSEGFARVLTRIGTGGLFGTLRTLFKPQCDEVGYTFINPYGISDNEYLFAEAHDFSNGFSRVSDIPEEQRDSDKPGIYFINTSMVDASDCFLDAFDFKQNHAPVKTADGWYFLNNEGNLESKCFVKIERPLKKGYVAAVLGILGDSENNKEGYWLVTDKNGLTYPLQFDLTPINRNDFVAKEFKDGIGFVDRNGVEYHLGLEGVYEREKDGTWIVYDQNGFFHMDGVSLNPLYPHRFANIMPARFGALSEKLMHPSILYNQERGCFTKEGKVEFYSVDELTEKRLILTDEELCRRHELGTSMTERLSSTLGGALLNGPRL